MQISFINIKGHCVLGPEENSALCQLWQKDENYNENAITVTAKKPCLYDVSCLDSFGYHLKKYPRSLLACLFPCFGLIKKNL